MNVTSFEENLKELQVLELKWGKMRADLARKLLEEQDTVFRQYYETKWGNGDRRRIRSGECRRTRTCRTRRIHSDWQRMKSREKAPSCEGRNTHTHMLGAGGRSGRSIYIYVIYIYMLSTYYYTYKVVSMQQVHVKVVHILIRRVVQGGASG